MAGRCLVFVALLALLVPSAEAQDAKAILDAASGLWATANLKSIQYSGTGWVGAVGQSFNAALVTW